MLVISRHLDDAVFSCGAALAASPGAVVCTVFSGARHEALVTDWDTQCGFANAHEAMHARRAEDAAALDGLDARPLHLDLLDSQYPRGVSTTSDEIASALVGAIRANASGHFDPTVSLPFRSSYRACSVPQCVARRTYADVHRLRRCALSAHERTRSGTP